MSWHVQKVAVRPNNLIIFISKRDNPAKEGKGVGVFDDYSCGHTKHDMVSWPGLLVVGVADVSCTGTM